MWNHIRQNDVWFDVNLGKGNRRTVSVAWGIFYRIAKHEMADLEKDGLFPKSLGHLRFDPDTTGVYLREDETLANTIEATMH